MLDFNKLFLKALLYFVATDLVNIEFEDLLKFKFDSAALFLSFKELRLTILFDSICLSESYLDFKSYSCTSITSFTLFYYLF